METDLHYQHRTEEDFAPGQTIYRVDVGVAGEKTWGSNALRFESPQEAENYAHDLLRRWMLADLARVVQNDVPTKEPIDTDDDRIVLNYRT